MALSGALLAKVNNALNTIANAIETREATYFTNNGHYWQGLLTPTLVPLDGVDTTPDFTRHPTDQIDTWADFISGLPATFPIAIFVDVHNGPLGQGFTMGALAQVSADGFYLRTRGVGNYGVTSAGWDKLFIDPTR